MPKFKINQVTAVIIAAIIGLIGTFVAGYFAIQAAIEPIKIQISATQTAKSFLTPVMSSPAATPSIIVATSSPSLSLTSPTPVPIKAGQDLQNECISASLWTPYQGIAHEVDRNSCWQLADWGLSAQNGGLLILTPNNGMNFQEHSIYTPLNSRNVDISFDLQIDKFYSSTTISDYFPNVGFGIINTQNENTIDGHVIYYFTSGYFQPTYIALGENYLNYPGATYEYMSPGQWIEYLPHFLRQYTMSQKQHVIFSIKGIVLDIYIDGNLIASGLPLTFDANKAFWIGYHLDTRTDLQASLTNLSITEIH